MNVGGSRARLLVMAMIVSLWKNFMIFPINIINKIDTLFFCLMLYNRDIRIEVSHLKSNILLLVLMIIFITGCNGANNEAIPYDTSNLEVKEVTQLTKKSMIEFEEVEEVEEIEEETKDETETQDEPEKTEKNEEVKAPEKTEQKIVISDEDKSNYNISDVDQKTGLYIVSNPSSIEVYLNKNRKLPTGYAPNDLVEPDVSHTKPKGDERRLLRADAASALEALFSTAFEEEGIELAAVSGYRSHQTQTNIYQGHVNRSGQDYANRFSARPGTSEHETGLAMDVSAAVVGFALEQVFKETTEGSWLADNAHRFGFIIRYPEDKEHITGYGFEPWHLRYVGKSLAEHLYHNSLTLEEYFGYHIELNN